MANKLKLAHINIISHAPRNLFVSFSLALPTQHLENPHLDMSGARHRPGLKHIQLMTEKMLLLFHFQIQHRGFPSEHEELPDRMGARHGAMGIR